MECLGSGVLGSRVLGSGVLGSGVLGSGVLGRAVLGVHCSDIMIKREDIISQLLITMSAFRWYGYGRGSLPWFHWMPQSVLVTCSSRLRN